MKRVGFDSSLWWSEIHSARGFLLSINKSILELVSFAIVHAVDGILCI